MQKKIFWAGNFRSGEWRFFLHFQKHRFVLYQVPQLSMFLDFCFLHFLCKIKISREIGLRTNLAKIYRFQRYILGFFHVQSWHLFGSNIHHLYVNGYFRTFLVIGGKGGGGWGVGGGGANGGGGGAGKTSTPTHRGPGLGGANVLKLFRQYFDIWHAHGLSKLSEVMAYGHFKYLSFGLFTNQNPNMLVRRPQMIHKSRRSARGDVSDYKNYGRARCEPSRTQLGRGILGF